MSSVPGHVRASRPSWCARVIALTLCTVWPLTIRGNAQTPDDALRVDARKAAEEGRLDDAIKNVPRVAVSVG